jgi:hypothetical protein
MTGNSGSRPEAGCVTAVKLHIVFMETISNQVLGRLI